MMLRPAATKSRAATRVMLLGWNGYVETVIAAECAKATSRVTSTLKSPQPSSRVLDGAATSS